MESSGRWSASPPANLHGEQVTYYPDGSVAERENRKAGLLNGAHTRVGSPMAS
jgi:antitoxin component YwqK of YwqJK toxin-antitoxin module